LHLPTRIATEKPLEWISAANAVALLESKAKMIAFTILPGRLQSSNLTVPHRCDRRRLADPKKQNAHPPLNQAPARLPTFQNP
jgi:hypothetical protein